VFAFRRAGSPRCADTPAPAPTPTHSATSVARAPARRSVSEGAIPANPDIRTAIDDTAF
jgi:hypothetical protein